MQGVQVRTDNTKHGNSNHTPNATFSSHPFPFPAPRFARRSDFCGGTLTSIDLSHCSLLSHDALGWIAGCLGHNKPGCRNLRSIDVSDCKSINDSGLEYLGRGCRKLKYAAFRNDARITSKGLTKFAEGCRHLKVLNVENCDQIDNQGLIALGMNCKTLLSLNFSRISNITDHGVAGLSIGCPRLQVRKDQK